MGGIRRTKGVRGVEGRMLVLVTAGEGEHLLQRLKNGHRREKKKRLNKKEGKTDGAYFVRF